MLVSTTAPRNTQPESRLAAKGARKRSDPGDRLVAPLGKAARKRDIVPVHDIRGHGQVHPALAQREVRRESAVFGPVSRDVR